jgi:hypothetical protein
MDERNRIWACLVQMAHSVYPDDPNLAAIHAIEGFLEE